MEKLLLLNWDQLSAAWIWKAKGKWRDKMLEFSSISSTCHVLVGTVLVLRVDHFKSNKFYFQHFLDILFFFLCIQFIFKWRQLAPIKTKNNHLIKAKCAQSDVLELKHVWPHFTRRRNNSTIFFFSFSSLLLCFHRMGNDFAMWRRRWKHKNNM